MRLNQKGGVLEGTVERAFPCAVESSRSKFTGSMAAAGMVIMYIESGETKAISTYLGQLSADGRTLTGTFTSYGVNGQPIPLTLSR